MVKAPPPWARVAAALAGWLALLVAATWPALRAPLTHAPGIERGDLWNALWGAGFVHDSLARGALPWRTELLDAPEGGVLWVADPLGALVMAALGPPRAATWTLVSVLRLVGAAATMDVFTRAWLRSRTPLPDATASHAWAGWVAGAVWMLASPLTMCLRNGTSEGTDGLTPVLAVYLAWRAVRAPSAGRLLAAAGGMGLACVANPYGALVAGLGIVAVLGAEDAPLGRRFAVLGICAATAVLWAAVLTGLLAHPDQLARGVVVTTGSGPSPGADLAGWWTHTCGLRPRPGPDGELAHCHAVAPGVLALAALGIASGRRDARGVTAWALLAIVGATLASGTRWTLHGATVGAGVPTAWGALPAFVTRTLGQPWRLSLGVWFAASVLAGWGALRASRVRGGMPAVALAMLVTVVRTPEAHRPAAVATQAPSALRALRDAPPGAAIPYPAAAGRHALWDQRTHGKPLLVTLNEARTERARKVLEELRALPQDPEGLRAGAARVGRAAGVRYLVVRTDAPSRTDPARDVAERLLAGLPPVGADGEGVAVRALW